MTNFTKTTKKISLIIAFSIFLSSCVSSTYISSIPNGADLYVDGQPVGQTPHMIKDSKPLFSCTSIRIEKEDYNTLYTEICKDEEVNAGAIIGGFFFMPIFLWALKYKPSYTFQLMEKEQKDDTFDSLIEKKNNKK